MLQVESFEDLQKDTGIAIHKPFYCSLHPGESVKFFCIGCQVTIVLLTDSRFLCPFLSIWLSFVCFAICTGTQVVTIQSDPGDFATKWQQGSHPPQNCIHSSQWNVVVTIHRLKRTTVNPVRLPEKLSS